MSIEEIAKRRGYTSVFLTLTVPSHFHPFVSRKKGTDRIYLTENKSFKFSSLFEATTEAYKHLNHIFKTFYKRVKNFVKKNEKNEQNEFLFTRVVECHSGTMIPHIHAVLYFPLEFLDAVRGVFKRVVEHFELSSVDFESVNFKENLSSAGRYLIKYITKDFKSGVDAFKIRTLDGWSKLHRIRTLSNSQLPLNVFLYRTIYHALSFNDTNINSKNKKKLISK